jgi:hypothetical protein
VIIDVPAMASEEGLEDDSCLRWEDIDTLDPATKALLMEWLRWYRLTNKGSDALSCMYDFSRLKMGQREGLVMTRRASLDPAKDDVIREIAKGLEKKKSEFVASFIKEWIDLSDDPSGIIINRKCPTTASSSPSVTRVFDEEELDQLISWENDFLSLSESELVTRSVKIYKLWGFCPQFVDLDKISSFVRLVSENYRSENPYHNFHHAHSVMAITANLLSKTCRGVFSNIEDLGILTAAMCHDVGHRGLNSDYYIKTRHALAIQYNDNSVLENMHCSLTFELLRSSEAVDFTKSWSDDEYIQFRRIVIQSIMATDMKVHFDLTGGLQKFSGKIDDAENKKLVYQSIVHAADLSNPVMPTKPSFQWAFRVVEEMYEQGRLEEQDGFVVAPFMRYPPTETVEFAKLQVSFIEFIVAPLWKSMAVVWPSLQDRVSQMEKNLKFWESLKNKQKTSKN